MRHAGLHGGINTNREGMRMRRGCASGRQLAGCLLVLSGVFLVFLCLPMEFFLIVLGVALAAAGLLLLR